MSNSLQHNPVYKAWSTREPDIKCQLVQRLYHNCKEEKTNLSCWVIDAFKSTDAGRPDKPELVPPLQVKHRGFGSDKGRAGLIHAICHIEFNAINLALDAMLRFKNMPELYYYDWLSVASDEARHFKMLEQRLMDYGYSYGDFPAHNGLWEMAIKTRKDCLKRMALVPRVLEARGLDVTPLMLKKLNQAKDFKTVEVLEVILQEEVGHVEIGTRWFDYLCNQQNLDPVSTFAQLLAKHYSGLIKKPFNTAARIQAGFKPAEMEILECLADGRSHCT